MASAERSVHGGRSMARSREGSRHGPSDRSFRGLASAALAAVRLERSAHGGRSGGASREGSRHGPGGSVRGGREGSTHGGDRASFKGMTLAALASMRTERSVHGGQRSGSASREASRHNGAAQLPRSASAAKLADLSRAGSAVLDGAGVSACV